MLRRRRHPHPQQQQAAAAAAAGPPVELFAACVVDRSSEYSKPNWSAAMVCGPPRVYPTHGDHPKAWAPMGYGQDYNREFLIFAFDRCVHVDKVRIWETNAPGGVVRLSVAEFPHPDFSPSMEADLTGWAPLPKPNPILSEECFTTIWSGAAEVAPRVARIFEPELHLKGVKAQILRIDMDFSRFTDWYEMDAVSICGPPVIADPSAVTVKETVEESEKAVGQWVTEVLDYSTEYGNPGWAAFQVVGPPSVYPSLIDSADTWAPRVHNRGPEHLVVRMDRPVRIEQILVWETLNPGAIVRISALPLTPIEAAETGVLGGPAKPRAIGKSYRGLGWIEATGTSGTPDSLPTAGWELLWSGPTQFQQQTAARIFQPQLHRSDVVAQVVKIELDTLTAPSWPEIDAIQIRGYPVPCGRPFEDLHHIFPVSQTPTGNIASQPQPSSPICLLSEYCLARIATYLPLSSLARLSQTCKVLNTVLQSDHVLSPRISRLRILAINPAVSPLFGSHALDVAVPGPPTEPPQDQFTYTAPELLKAFGEAMLFRPPLALCIHSSYSHSGPQQRTCACPLGADRGKPSVGPRVEMPSLEGLDFARPAYTVELWFRVAAEPEEVQPNAAQTEARRGIGGTLFGYQSVGESQFASLYVGEDGFIRKTLSFSDPRTLEGPFVADGLWHHVAISCTPAEQRMFVDGILADSSQPVGDADVLPYHHCQIGTGLISSAMPGRPTYASFAQRATGPAAARNWGIVRTELLLDGAHWFPFAGDVMETRVWRVALRDAADVRALMQVAVVGNHWAVDQTGGGSRGGSGGGVGDDRAANDDAPPRGFAAAPREFAKRYLVARVSGARGCRFPGNAEPVGRGALLRKAVAAAAAAAVTDSTRTLDEPREWRPRPRRPPAIDGVDDSAIEAVLQRAPVDATKAARAGFVAFGVGGGYVGTPWEARQ